MSITDETANFGCVLREFVHLTKYSIMDKSFLFTKKYQISEPEMLSDKCLPQYLFGKNFNVSTPHRLYY